jgi:hypothetical protein
MPETFEREILWASNGKVTGIDDVIGAWNKGSGFVFMSGHGSPNSWGDHFLASQETGNMASFTGLVVKGYMQRPFMPIDSLSNNEKLPVTVIGGCHNSQFNVSMVLQSWTYCRFIFRSCLKDTCGRMGRLYQSVLAGVLFEAPEAALLQLSAIQAWVMVCQVRILQQVEETDGSSIEFFRQYG